MPALLEDHSSPPGTCEVQAEKAAPKEAAGRQAPGGAGKACSVTELSLVRDRKYVTELSFSELSLVRERGAKLIGAFPQGFCP